MKKQVVVLISGRGSNFISLFENSEHYEIIGLISDKEEAKGLEFAIRNGIPTAIVSRRIHGTKLAQHAELLKVVKSLSPDYIALAGFMQILQPAFIQTYLGKIINIHPSLLPEFPGLNTHQRALNSKAKNHGCSVHFVDTGLDTGPVIAQISIAINPDDNCDSLASRVLAKEHLLYPFVLNGLACDDIQLTKESGIIIHPKTLARGIELGIDWPST